MRATFLSLLLAIACCAWAQTDEPKYSIVDAINNAGGSVYIDQPRQLMRFVGRDGDGEYRQSNRNAGFRVQIFSDNNMKTAKQNAEFRNSSVKSHMPEVSTYLIYDAPYWKVRVGDCRSYAEAEALARELKNAFPSFAGDMMIIRERVNTAQ